MNKLKIFLSALIASLFVFAAGGSEDSDNSSSKSANIGDEVVLEQCFGASTKETYDELTNACTAKDNAGLSQMILAGKACIIENGTSGKVIDNSWTITRVRLSDGRAAWVDHKFVKKK